MAVEALPREQIAHAFFDLGCIRIDGGCIGAIL
jgi:hypothetical protein